jgi:hypothetical protein
MASEATLARLIADHRAAVSEFVERASLVPPGRWNAPRGPGKWTPGQEVKHVILAYESFTRDLRGGPPMRLIGTWWKRIIWRAIGLTSILHFKRIPSAARAPRESRPTEESGTAAVLLPDLRARVDEFERAFAETWRTTPAKRVTHPYFGMLSLTQSMTMAAVHTRHHAAFLQRSATTASRTASEASRSPEGRWV